MTLGPQTQEPRASRHSLPLSLYLKTWGRQRAAGRQGRGGDTAGRAAGIPRSPALALAQQPPKAGPKVTPQ